MRSNVVFLDEAGEQDRIIKVHRSKIRPFKNQPRKRFDPKRLEELAESIKQICQKKPIHVRPVSGDPAIEFEIIDGERRWQACEIARIDYLKCIVDTPADEREQYLDSITANFGGEPHTDIEEIQAVSKMRLQYKMTVAEIAARCSQAPEWVYQRLRIAEHIAPEVIAMMDEDLYKRRRLSFSTTLFMVNLPVEDQKELAQEIVTKGLRFSQARHLIEKRLITKRIVFRTPSNEPLKKLKRLNGSVYRMASEFDLLLEKDVNYFKHIFECRPASDREYILDMLRKIMGDAKDLMVTISNLKSASPGS